ncbi:MAG TPA: hypothetical protein VKV02_05475, partial [Acidobacteriaceae bacterium]|nr:hypothetical protein [Acidobacteriaceae bacterium]
MPPFTPTPTEDPELEPTRSAVEAEETASLTKPDPDAPVSFVPHVSIRNTARLHPLRLRTGRYGELDEHELVTLLDTLEDERARARFRESVYISVFVWIAIALLMLFGPKYLWHAPRVVLPSEVLRQREITTLTDPSLHAPAPRTSPPPSVDNRTLEHLRSTAPRVPAPSTPRAEQPAPEAAPRVTSPRTQPPSTAPNLAPATAPPNLPAAPAPQPVAPRPA